MSTLNRGRAHQARAPSDRIEGQAMNGIVCICGSTRFKAEISQARAEFTYAEQTGKVCRLLGALIARTIAPVRWTPTVACPRILPEGRLECACRGPGGRSLDGVAARLDHDIPSNL